MKAPPDRVQFTLPNDEYSRFERLNYFEICCLLYFIKNKDKFHQQKKVVIDEAAEILAQYDPLIFSESAHLLLDLISCPYIKKKFKNRFIEAAFSHTDNWEPTPQSIGRFRNFVSDQTWYLNWNQKNNLRALLEKKQYLRAY